MKKIGSYIFPITVKEKKLTEKKGKKADSTGGCSYHIKTLFGIINWNGEDSKRFSRLNKSI